MKNKLDWFSHRVDRSRKNCGRNNVWATLEFCLSILFFVLCILLFKCQDIVESLVDNGGRLSYWIWGEHFTRNKYLCAVLGEVHAELKKKLNINAELGSSSQEIMQRRTSLKSYVNETMTIELVSFDNGGNMKMGAVWLSWSFRSFDWLGVNGLL